MPVSYEEYENSWDIEDQSKRCKRALNCLLLSCRCKRETAASELIRNECMYDVTTAESSQTLSLPVHVFPDAAVVQCTGWYSITTMELSADTTSASLNHTPDTVSQLHRI